MKNITISCDQCGVEINHSSGFCAVEMGAYNDEAAWKGFLLGYRFGPGKDRGSNHWCSLNCTVKFLEIKLSQMRERNQTI